MCPDFPAFQRDGSFASMAALVSSEVPDKELLVEYFPVAPPRFLIGNF
jgi:hypothetical protein